MKKLPEVAKPTKRVVQNKRAWTGLTQSCMARPTKIALDGEYEKVATSGHAYEKICSKQEAMDQADTRGNLAHWACSTIVLAMPAERDCEYEKD